MRRAGSLLRVGGGLIRYAPHGHKDPRPLRDEGCVRHSRGAPLGLTLTPELACLASGTASGASLLHSLATSLSLGGQSLRSFSAEQLNAPRPTPFALRFGWLAHPCPLGTGFGGFAPASLCPFVRFAYPVE